MKRAEQELCAGTGGAVAPECRLLCVGGKHHVWIEKGVLHLPAEVLHPLVMLTCGRPIHIVTTARGRRLTFMRAADVIAESPKLTELVMAVAARFECSL
jgi:hypothetical protein